MYHGGRFHVFHCSRNFAGIKNWVCNICQKACATKSKLKVHLRYHGGRFSMCYRKSPQLTGF